MPGPAIPADARRDYRAFRLVALGAARLVVACLVLVAWNLAFFRQRETLLFLGNSLFLALGVSLASALVAYLLFHRRGGRIEKTTPPLRR